MSWRAVQTALEEDRHELRLASAKCAVEDHELKLSKKRCGAIGDTDDCLMCAACRLHLHARKGSRRVAKD